jgi:hypothetical protein
VQTVIDGELAWAVAQAHRDGADRASLTDVILKLTGEVRQQLGLHLAITRALVDMRVVREFQETVIDVIREESPEDSPPDCGPPESPPGAAAERGSAGAGRGRIAWRSGVTRSTS